MPTSGLGSKHKNAFLAKVVERNVELERISREQEETIQSLRNEIQVLQLSNVNIVDQNKAIENEELKQRLLAQNNDMNILNAELYKVRSVEQSLSVALKDKQEELKNVQNQMFYLLKMLQSLDSTQLNSMQPIQLDYKSFVELCTLLKVASIKDEEILSFSMSGTIVSNSDLHMFKQLHMYVSKLQERNTVLAKETQQILKSFLPNIQNKDILEKFSSILAVVYSGHINIGCLYNKIANIVSVISIPASINKLQSSTDSMLLNMHKAPGSIIDRHAGASATNLSNDHIHGHFGSVPNIKINTFNTEPVPFVAQEPPYLPYNSNELLNHSKSVPVRLNEVTFLNEDAAGAPIPTINNLDQSSIDPPSGPIIDLQSATTTDSQHSSFSAPLNPNELLNPYMDTLNISNRHASNASANAFNESDQWR